ncbi:MAG: hypothetical protein Q9220_006092 [cf. Caloplaca sp. 1 TL-2023]
MRKEMLQVARENLAHQRAHKGQMKVMDEAADYVRAHGTLDSRHEHKLAMIAEPPDHITHLQEEGQAVEDTRKLPDRYFELPAEALATSADSLARSKYSSDSITTDFYWQGCVSLICPEYRLSGDHRANCAALVKKCQECGINVCPDCWEKNPPCDCSYCKDNYHCPNCFIGVGEYRCRKAEELERQRQEEELAQTKEAAASGEVKGSGHVEEEDEQPPGDGGD